MGIADRAQQLPWSSAKRNLKTDQRFKSSPVTKLLHLIGYLRHRPVNTPGALTLTI